MPRTNARLALPTLAAATLFGCIVQIDGSLDVGDDEADTSNEDDASTDSGGSSDEGYTIDPDPTNSTEDEGETDTGLAGDGCAQAIDILFVIDNSGSMAEEQRQVVDAIGSMVASLDLAGMDWRIGVTTTDNGNPWCPASSTTPEAGRLVSSSCRERLGDFLFSDTVDVQESGCLDVCAHEQIAMASTVIDGVVQPAGHWVERIDGVANTVAPQGDGFVEVDPVEALRCILPQGVNGCGFESQLESMNLAIARSFDAEPNLGFLRDDAQLAVVIISDESDCSYDQDWVDIFMPEGNKTFWTDPSASFPTSAVCWNAGMRCIGDGPVYSDCVAVDKDVEGNELEGANEGSAVLHPVSRYAEVLANLEHDKQQVDPDAKVLVFGVVGVQLDGSLHFEDVGDSDPAFQDSFGIGPGCTGEGNAAASPPGRMREVVGEFDGTLHSVCKTQYIDAFKTIANRVTADCGQ
ncbi:hypothetical protein ACNOYE_36340 [Nannocystaceae bacterium ST9]